MQVNGGGGEKILFPGTPAPRPRCSLSTNSSGYELVVLQFDGSNFRIVSTTPLTANANGMSMLIGTPASSSAACQTGALQIGRHLSLPLHRAEYLEARRPFQLLAAEQHPMPRKVVRACAHSTASYSWGRQGLEAQFGGVFQPGAGSSRRA